MDKIGIEILRNYGIAGMIVASVLVFCGWIIHKILNHFMQNIKEKDGQINLISERFANSLDANTKAINELTQSEVKLTSACENITKGFDRMASQNGREHTQILNFVSGCGNK